MTPTQHEGAAARDGLRAHGVDTDAIGFEPGRMGLYFLTPGAVLRPSEIIYDRAGSAFALADPARYDWAALLAGAAWLHVSGVSPAVGDGAAQAVLDAMRAAMWQARGSDGAAVLRELLAHADLAFADQRDIALVLERPELAHVDRIGTGDAFAAGVLHGLRRGWDDAATIEFGAAATLKHAIAGDFNLADEAQIPAVQAGALHVRR